MHRTHSSSGHPFAQQKDSFLSSEESCDPSLVVEHVEDLFLMGRFKEALSMSVAELERICGKTLLKHQEPGKASRVTSTERCNDLVEQEKTARIGLLADYATRLVALVIQILFELDRHSEVMDFVTTFYGTTTERVPFQIFLLILNLQISLGNLEKAKRMVVEHLRYRKNADLPEMSSKGKEKQDQYDALTQIQYSTIAELFVTRILLPLRHFDDAKAFVAVLNGSISPIKSKTLNEEIEKSILTFKEERSMETKRKEYLYKIGSDRQSPIYAYGDEQDGEEEIQVERYKERTMGADEYAGYEGRSRAGEEDDEIEYEGSEDDEERVTWVSRENRIKRRHPALEWSSDEDGSMLATRGPTTVMAPVAETTTVVMEWMTGMWDSASAAVVSQKQNLKKVPASVLVAAVLSFVVSFIFIYMRKEVVGRLSHVMGNFKELLALAFNFDRSVTNTAMMRRRRLQR